MGLDLDAAARAELWGAVVKGVESYLAEVVDLGASGNTVRTGVGALLAELDFDRPRDPGDALELVLRGLREQQQHGRHPRSFGLFDAAPTSVAVAGDTLASVFNACLATRDGSPFGVAAEDKLIAAFGAKFGYPLNEIDGIVTSGGSESNLSAVLLALRHRYVEYRDAGLVELTGRPTVYVTAEAHPSVPRAVRLAGLGARSVRTVETDPTFRMDLAALRDRIESDRRAGMVPLAIVVTAGTTGAGIVDPLDGAADLADEYGLWLHVDAAWGGAAALLPELRPVFRGLGRADSVTFDPHKWMSVPLGMSLLLTRHRNLLERTFGVDETFLDETPGSGDPFAKSIRWSHGFSGLKLLLPLAVFGWRGFEESLRHQVRLGDELRDRLARSGWRIINDTPLPVVCFVPEDEREQTPDRLRLIAKTVNASGQARVFVVKTGRRHTLRACVTNHATTSADISVLVDLLGETMRRAEED